MKGLQNNEYTNFCLINLFLIPFLPRQVLQRSTDFSLLMCTLLHTNKNKKYNDFSLILAQRIHIGQGIYRFLFLIFTLGAIIEQKTRRLRFDFRTTRKFRARDFKIRL